MQSKADCFIGRYRSWVASSRKPSWVPAGYPARSLLMRCTRTANPAYTAEELVYQLRLIKARILIVHPWVLPVALEAARTYGITPDRIILFDPVAGSSFDNIQDLVKLGLGQVQQFTPLRLSPGDAKKKLALLSFSSGTTGNPKVFFSQPHLFKFGILMHPS